MLSVIKLLNLHLCQPALAAHSTERPSSSHRPQNENQDSQKCHEESSSHPAGLCASRGAGNSGRGTEESRVGALRGAGRRRRDGLANGHISHAPWPQSWLPRLLQTPGSSAWSRDRQAPAPSQGGLNRALQSHLPKPPVLPPAPHQGLPDTHCTVCGVQLL